jgi:fructose-bisphosphate aldolase class II
VVNILAIRADPDPGRKFVFDAQVLVGTIHGVLRSMIRGETQKHLNIERIEEIKTATNIFITLHGGPGTNDEDLRQAINVGITVIHINTELVIAWRQGIEMALAQQPGKITSYKVLPAALEAMKDVIWARPCASSLSCSGPSS